MEMYIAIAIVVLLSLSSWTTESIAQPVPKEVFILAGQSNMAGRGGVFNGGKWNKTVPLEDTPDPSKVFRLAANLTWEVAEDPLHWDIEVGKPSGVGPGMSFANAVKDSMGSPVGLVPCAIGGSTMATWARGQGNYENMVKRAKEATRDGSKINALLWYQGESDTTSDEQVNTYRENMNTLIANIREDLNLPSLPIIQVVIAGGLRGGDPKRADKIREIQSSIDLPFVSHLDAKGLELYDDDLLVHLTTASQVKMGHMLAKEYLDKFATKTK